MRIHDDDCAPCNLGGASTQARRGLARRGFWCRAAAVA